MVVEEVVAVVWHDLTCTKFICSEGAERLSGHDSLKLLLYSYNSIFP